MHRFGQAHGLGEADAGGRIASVEDAPIGEHKPIFRDGQLPRHGAGEQIASALGGLDRRVPHHQRHTARIRAEIDRRQVRVAGHRANVDRLDSQHFRHAPHQHIV